MAMIRTMWLGLFFLVALVAIAALRFVVTKSSAEIVSSASLPTIGQADSSVDGALTKGDRLPLFHSSEQPSVPATRSVIASEAPEVSAKIISRHWHDPSAKQTSVKPHSRAVKP
jgi:hypothetical protein